MVRGPRIGSTPTPRDPKTEKVRNQLPAGNPYARRTPPPPPAPAESGE
jgi:hypothetical protein